LKNFRTIESYPSQVKFTPFDKKTMEKDFEWFMRHLHDFKQTKFTKAVMGTKYQEDDERPDLPTVDTSDDDNEPYALE
jgi:hypothetical protein